MAWATKQFVEFIKEGDYEGTPQGWYFVEEDVHNGEQIDCHGPFDTEAEARKLLS